MAQKKSYSRYFIILQEDEKGYSLASDKIASGYAKLEMKNDKCKISYYVQNLKKEKTPYYMILICNKKDAKNIIKIGEMNIDDYGRADICYEYPVSDVAGSGVAMDKVSGAAIVRILDNNIISVMSGFASTEIPEWKDFAVLEDRSKSSKGEKDKKVEEPKTVELKEDKKSIFDKYEESIEKAKINKEKEENINEESGKQNEKSDSEIPVQDPEVEDICSKPEEQNEEAFRDDKNEEEDEKDQFKDEKKEIENDENKTPEDKRQHETVEEDNLIYVNNPIDKSYKKSEQNTRKCKKSETTNKYEDHHEGHKGDFFSNLMSGFKETKSISKELKRCKWYKIPVSSMEDMYNMDDYNKYALVYYPMIGYYPYIKKHCHYLTGYKYDKKGRIKYLIYGILGTRDKRDQPYGGKSGFVTWISLKDKNKTGYWLMFYDFRTNTVVIPVRK